MAFEQTEHLNRNDTFMNSHLKFLGRRKTELLDHAGREDIAKQGIRMWGEDSSVHLDSWYNLYPLLASMTAD